MITPPCNHRHARMLQPEGPADRRRGQVRLRRTPPTDMLRERNATPARAPNWMFVMPTLNDYSGGSVPCS